MAFLGQLSALPHYARARLTTDLPLAKSTRGAPLLYGALGVSIHLEALGASDGERLVAACDRALEWIGPKLRWTWSSVASEVRAFRPEDLELVTTTPSRLTIEDLSAYPTARAKAGAAMMAAAKVDRFGIACHGGGERNDASPFSFRFYMRALPPAAEGEPIVARAMLSLTVPESWALDDFVARTTAIASDLRLRWGAAGLAYGAWEHDRYGETRDALHAHARRHPGYDMGQHATLMNAFHNRARTVSFLTFVGPAFAAKVAKKTPDALASDDLVTASKAGDAICLRAGERPLPGDVNRNGVPLAYARADRKIKPIRASEGVHFMAPWTEKTTEAWLARFESAHGAAS
jgi:hypothetical protein